jgi:uncharacterized protein (TIGR02145 family)
MKKLFIVTICFFALVTLNGQIVQQRLPGAEEISNRRTSFNLEEIKVRWKKVALENCPGVPCTTATVPGPPTSVTASAGNASSSVAFVAPTNNGGSAITGYTVTSSPGGITATGPTSPINVTGLTNGTAYTFRVIATNAIGNSSPSTASSAVTPSAPSFTCGTSTVADIDGNTYNTVLIGTQCWTKENLKVTKYNDGTAIHDETANNAGWGGLTTGARSIHTGYTGSSSYIATYGYLYNWYAATDNRKLCPTGWHIPTEPEWNSLFNSIGGILVAGPKMTYNGSSLWTSLTTTVDNSSGFTAIPGGYRSFLGSFWNIGIVAEFWGSSVNPSNSNQAWSFYIEDGSISVGYNNKPWGSSIRCLKD